MTYAGASDGPAWSPQHVQGASGQVLVITVEPPQPGDGTYPLRPEFIASGKTYRAGTVFVRRERRRAEEEKEDRRQRLVPWQ